MDLLPNSNPSIAGFLRAASYGGSLHGRGREPWTPAPTIAISRQVGASGTTLARAVGARLGWSVYDHELIEQIAQEANVSVTVLENLDERGSTWLQDCLESFAGERRVTESSYCHYLVLTLFSLAQRGRCVIVGRGAAQVLPSTSTLRVRLVAALEDRVRVIGNELRLSPAEAAHYIERTDRERVRFIKEHFHRDPADPLQYDLMVNSSRFSLDRCTDLIVDALRCWEPAARGVAPAAGPVEPAMAS